MSNKVTLPAGATLGKSFEYGIDYNAGTVEAPDWRPFRRISGFNPTPTPTTQDAQTYDDLGAQNNDVTGWSWNIAFNVQVNRLVSSGLYLPEVEYLLARTRPSSKGEGAVGHFRWYHKPETGTPNPTDAGEGFATVSTSRQNTGPNGEIEQLSVTLTGKGPYEEIANPFQGWSVTAPAIHAISPSGQGAGELVTITGTGFAGASAVSFDGIAAADIEVVNGATIIAALPVDDAGDVPVVVTTPGGASAPVSYSRGA